MDCPEAGEEQLLHSVPGPLSQFAGRLAYLSLWNLHGFFPPQLTAVFLSSPHFSIVIQALTFGGVLSQGFY